MPKISVVIPVYNTVGYLPRCLETVLGQTHRDLEVVLINDGSSDGSTELCDAYGQRDARVKVIHQKNAGAAAAKNTGLDAATGDYIGFVDSDDWIALDMYAFLLQLLENAKADIAEIMLEVAHSDDHQMRSGAEHTRCFTGDDILVYYLEHNEFAMGLRLYRREIFTNLRFDSGRMTEDVVAGFLALRKAGKLVASNRPMYYYFSNPRGVSESPLRERDFDLLYAGDRLDELTADTDNQHLRTLALTKKYRAPFTLLVKMALFGCSSELDARETKQKLQAAVRPHYRFLMASGMPFNRKLMLTVSCFCYPLLRITGSVFRALRSRA